MTDKTNYKLAKQAQDLVDAGYQYNSDGELVKTKLMTNDELDLKLFKACYPKCKIHYSAFDDEHHYPEFIPSGKPIRTHRIDLRPVPQFTKDIGVCFAILIPEMNRRGWYLNKLSQDADCVGELMWYCEFENNLCEKIFSVATEPQIAISKAAYEALKGEKC